MPKGEPPLIVQLIRASGRSDIADEIESCGTHFVYFWDTDLNRVISKPQLCRSRWCPRCAAVLRAKLAKRFTDFIGSSRYPHQRHITITQRDIPGESLEAASKRFRSHWTTLRRSEFWLHYIKRAHIKYEATWNNAENWWHFHAHVLADGPFVPKQALRRWWQRITGDSWIIDVDDVKPHTIQEFSSYFSKLRVVRVDKLSELIDYCARHRLVHTYGDKALPIEAEHPEKSDPRYIYLGTSLDIYLQVLESHYNPEVVSAAIYLLDEVNDPVEVPKSWRPILKDYLRHAFTAKLEAAV